MLWNLWIGVVRVLSTVPFCLCNDLAYWIISMHIDAYPCILHVAFSQFVPGLSSSWECSRSCLSDSQAFGGGTLDQTDRPAERWVLQQIIYIYSYIILYYIIIWCYIRKLLDLLSGNVSRSAMTFLLRRRPWCAEPFLFSSHPKVGVPAV